MARADCPKCGGTGWRTEETIGAKGVVRAAVLCDCAGADRAERLLERARIPKRYQHCDFENFESDNDYESQPKGRPWNSSLQRAKIEVQGFAANYPAGTDRGLLLMGPCGAGKTHLAVAAMKELLKRGHHALFYDYRELLKEIQASYNPASQTAEMEVLEPVLTTEVLLLDDLGASKPSDWALETVGLILNSRYNEQRATIVTTNYLDRDASAPVMMPSGQRAPKMEDALADRVGQRIRSRLYEMCHTVSIDAPDYRKEVRHAGRMR